jgi:hypothetical protein
MRMLVYGFAAATLAVIVVRIAYIQLFAPEQPQSAKDMKRRQIQQWEEEGGSLRSS